MTGTAVFGNDMPDRPVAGAARLDRPGLVITCCQGGIRAARTVLALERAGFERVLDHEGSWAEWSRAQMPAAIEPLPDPDPKT